MQSLFLYPCPSGERVVAVRHDWMSNCISNGVRLESVGALPPFIGNNRSTPRMTISWLLPQLPSQHTFRVLGGGEMDVTARDINWIKRPRHLPIFNTPRVFPDTPRVIPVTPKVTGARQRHTAQGGFPVKVKQCSNYATINTSIRGLCR
jgi:hypothetical protein